MPAKKTASKKRKKATASRKKAVSKKATARKSASKKRKVTKKKTSTSSRKKAASKKKTTAKKSTKKKSAKKKVAAKKAPARKKVSRKKPVTKKASKKKATVRKTASKKKVARKPAARKHARTTAASRSASKKRVPAKNLGMRRGGGQPSRGSVLTGPIHGIEPYKPKRGEEYMSPEQLEHFRQILTSWKRELMFEVDRTVHHMQDEAANFPDPNDRATQESEFGLELRTRDRERKLLRKIDSALSRIDDGSYGWCEETGEEIGLKRLEARPVATLCLEAQERRELAERQFRDRDDQYR